jgi:gliding motility-associated-like protein
LIGQSNEGTEFWFAFMEHRDVRANSKVVMITSKYDTDCTLTIAGLGYSTNVRVIANQVQLITMPLDAEVIGSERIQNLGIRVTSSLPVAVYIHQYASFRSEAAAILPVTSIGKEYFTLSYHSVRQGNEHYPSQFIIVGTKENTIVKIRHSTTSIGGKNKSEVETIAINQGQVYQVQAGEVLGDISGAYIEADNEVVVLCGAKWIEIPVGCGTRDNLIEMLAPVATWGRQFVSVPTSGSIYDKYRVIASEDNTTVSIENSKIIKVSLNRGEIHEFDTSEPIFVLASKPIQIAQYLIGNRCSGLNPNGDPSMLILNSIEQTKDTVTLFNSSLQAITSNFINVIMRTVDVPTVLFDGVPIQSLPNITKIAANPKYSYITIRVQAGAHTIIAKGCGVIANVYGYGEAESYAYGGGANYRDINTNPIPLGSCVNTKGIFNTGLDTTRYHHLWTFYDNTKYKDSKLEKLFPSVGTFPISLTIKDVCLDEIDSFNRDYQVTIRKALEISPQYILCKGEDLAFSVSDIKDATYLWQGPDNFRSEEQSPIIKDIQLEMKGKYTVVGSYFDCPTLPSFTNVTVHSLPKVQIEGDTIFCEKTDIVRLKGGEGFVSYLWSTSENSTSIEVNKSGVYRLNVRDSNQCENVTLLDLKSFCLPTIYTSNILILNENNNNLNNRFHPIIEDVISSITKIFDRWGNLIFQTKDNTEAWNGSVNGTLVNEGVYIFHIDYTFKDVHQNIVSSTKTGNITLLK